ncbi:MAG TPA: peptidoglycan DD-metalloendopeptidase family protein [Verrucomicrobiae bacterium]|nr:peptidoglycan DD-metalloendopeptidase family protein [Verrucomicrobiae bacterium]
MPRRPVNAPYTITTEFGVPDSYAKFGRHSGVDYAVPKGRPVYAPISGVLTNVVSPTGGNMVCIFDGQFMHRKMHNNAFARQNGSVQEGDIVAYAGSTGLSTGDHCHWDINDEGIYPTSFSRFKAPAEWLAGAYQPKPAPTPTPAADPRAGLEPHQRRLSNPDGVNRRSAPSTAAGTLIKEEPFDTDPWNFKGFVKGEMVNGNDIWFVGTSGNYFYSGAFHGGADTTGLQDLTPAKPIPVPKPEPIPTFEKELKTITEVIPAHPSNYEVGNFPAKPTGVVLHDLGTDGRDTLQSSLNHFGKENTTAPHITISGKRKIQNVSLKNRAYHAGPQGNDKIGIEIDPDVDTNPDTKNSVLDVLKELDTMYPGLTRYLHSQFMATSCGDDVQKANLLIPPEAPVSPRDEAQDKRLTAIEAALAQINAFIAKIKEFFPFLNK